MVISSTFAAVTSPKGSALRISLSLSRKCASRGTRQRTRVGWTANQHMRSIVLRDVCFQQCSETNCSTPIMRVMNNDKTGTWIENHWTDDPGATGQGDSPPSFDVIRVFPQGSGIDPIRHSVLLDPLSQRSEDYQSAVDHSLPDDLKRVPNSALRHLHLPWPK